jgi:putative ABC transport system permease protein
MRVGDLTALLRESVQRLTGTVLRRRRSDGDLAREIAFHIEQAELDLRSRGYSAQEAHRLARALSGSPRGAIEALRIQGGVPWLGMFTLDVTLGLRMLRKYWGLSLVGGLALAVVIGSCTGMFLYFDVFWGTALPIAEGDRVVSIQIWDPSARRRAETSLGDFDRWRDGMQSLEELGAFRTAERNLIVNGRAGERVAVAEMSAAGFRVARAAPLIGRGIVADDERPGAAPVVVIGYDEWQRRFDGDPDVLGRSLRLGDSFHTIVGVMPAAFGFPLNHRLWIPLRADAEGRLAAPPLGSVFARLAPGFEVENAQAELTAMGLLPDDTRAQDAGSPLLLVLPYAQNFIDDIDPDQYGGRASRARLVILLMSLLLVPPGLNIAMLVYARTATRQEEIAVRTALGASRRRIVVQLFIEMLVLSAVAAIVALAGVWLLAQYVEGLLVQQLVNLPFWIDVGMSTGAILLAAALALMAALLMGLMPALRATRQFARPGLGGLTSRNRARLGAFWTALIVAQIGFSFAMLPVATEIAWGTLRAHLLGPGFPSDEYLSAQLSLDTDAPVERAENPTAQAAAFARAQEELFRRIRAVPGVTADPTLVSAVPGTGPIAGVELEPSPALPTVGEPTQANWWNFVAHTMQVDAAFFETFEAHPLNGRGFTGDEFSTPSRSIVVSQRFVENTLQGASPLGLRLRYARPRGSAEDVSIERPWYEIVGVVPDIPAHPYSGTVYHPLAPGSARAASVVLRVAPGTPAFGNQLAEMAAATSPPLRVSEVRTLDELYSAQAFGNYVGGFALVAGTLSVLLLAAAGTYALMSFTVNDRRREIGVRVALGATKARLLGGVLKRALRQILAGAAVGVAVALLIESKLPAGSNGGIDIPGVLPIGASFVILVALLATLGPARRVLRLDPNEALRDGG